MLADNFKLLGKSGGDAQMVAELVVREALADRAARGVNYSQNWNMYQGNHEQYFKQRLDEPIDIFNYRKKNAIKNNLCGFTVDLSAKYLYGKASKVVRIFSEKIPETDKKMRKLLKNFHIPSFWLDCAKKAAVFGEVIVRLIPVDADNGEQVTGTTTPTTYPQPILMDPMRTYSVRNKWGKLVAVLSQYQTVDYSTSVKTVITELVVEDSRWMWKSAGALGGMFVDPLTGTGISSLLAGGELVTKQGGEVNTYRLRDEFVFFQNNADRKSDLDEIIDLNISLDEALTDKQHFFAKHGWPQLVTEVSLENVVHSPNKIWEVIPDVDDRKKVLDRMGFLTWDGKMEDHAKFVKNLERMIMIISQTAQISTGDLESIGQLRSGAALITAHSVAIHKTEAKQVIWEENEISFYEAMAAMDAYFHNEPVDGRYPDLDIVIRFPKDFVPGSEFERTNIQKAQLDSHMVPLADILEQNYGNIGAEAIEEKRKQIMKDSEDIVDSTREFISKTEGVSGSSGSPKEKSAEQSKPK